MAEETIYGYVLRFYKKLSSYDDFSVTQNSDYLIWMDYDGMNCHLVSSFENYNEFFNLESDLDVQCERQKLFLYCNTPSSSILKKNEYIEQPLIAIVTINFAYNNTIEDLNDLIMQIKPSYQINYELFGTLSLHNCIIVIRSNSYNEIDCFLHDLKNISHKKHKSIGKTYTLIGIEKEYSSNWNEKSKLYASIRISHDSKINDISYISSLFYDVLEEKSCSYSTFGKYDHGIEGYIKNHEAFVDLFSDGFFSGTHQYIYSTNTRFLTSRAKIENSYDEHEQLSLHTTNGNARKQELKRELTLIREEKKLSPRLIKSITRLAIRIYQTNISVYTSSISEEFYDLLNGLFRLIDEINKRTSKQKDIANHSFADIIASLNVLLDNRITANIGDFENAYNSLRFSGSCSKLLQAYSNLANNIVHATAQNDLKNYYIYMTTDIDTKLSLRQYFPKANIRYINIKMPIEIMFSTKYVLPWLIHEIGHVIRVGWNKYERNQSYFNGIGISLFNRAHKYYNDNLISSISTDSLCQCNEKCCEKFHSCKNKRQACFYEHFNDYSDLVKRYITLYITESDYSKKSLYNIPENEKCIYIKDMIEMCDILQDSYTEAIADVLMITLLKIKDSDIYLDILFEYFKNNQIVVDNNFSASQIIRILALLMLIYTQKNQIFINSPKEEEQFESFLEDMCNNHDNKLHNFYSVLCKKYNRFERQAKELYTFLYNKVYVNLDQYIENNKESKKTQQCIENNFYGIWNDPDNFSNHIKFIESFINSKKDFNR